MLSLKAYLGSIQVRKELSACCWFFWGERGCGGVGGRGGREFYQQITCSTKVTSVSKLLEDMNTLLNYVNRIVVFRIRKLTNHSAIHPQNALGLLGAMF